MAAPIKIDYIADWKKRLRGRLYTQFRNKVTWEGWVQLLGRQAQDTEDAAQSLLTLWDIANSEGVNLDRIGRAIGQKRLGSDDATYRLYLFARVLANKSSGTPEEIYSVMRALFGTTAGPRYYGGFVKAFSIRIAGAILTRAQALIAAAFLHDSKEAGARATLEWQEYADSLMFEFASDHATVSSTTSSGLIGGVTTTVPLVNATSFPDSGRVYISGSNNEYARYISKAGNTLTLSAAVTLGHSAGDTVEVIFGDGLGFDDGYFAGALQA